MKRILIAIVLVLAFSGLNAQDNRTTATRVADLLARMPVYNNNELARQMTQMTDMGKEGRSIICSMVTAPGTTDDTAARFAIESYSRYLSGQGNEKQAEEWEGECIRVIQSLDNSDIISFFMWQLVYVGGSRSADLAAKFLSDSRLCDPALAVIAAAGISDHQDILYAQIRKENTPCAAGIINLLAESGHDPAVEVIIKWYEKGDTGVKAAALNALSRSQSKPAVRKLREAASASGYSWEPTGATEALLEYCRQAGDRGDQATLQTICMEILKVSQASMQYRIAALSILAKYMGAAAMDQLFIAFRSPDIRFRVAAMSLAKDIPGEVATRRYIDLLASLDDDGCADMITMLGERGDTIARSEIVARMFGSPEKVRRSAVIALARMDGEKAAPDLIDFMKSFPAVDDQVAAMMALSTLKSKNVLKLISEAIEGSPVITRANLIIMLSTGGDNSYFDQVLIYCNSTEPAIRESAFYALQELAGPDNIPVLMKMLDNVADSTEIGLLQRAIANSVLLSENRDIAVEQVIAAMVVTEKKENYIGILPMVGGAKALHALGEQFESGRAEVRTVCFDALTSWPDFEVAYALFDIVSSGNKTYQSKAFDSYLQVIYGAPIPDEQKLLLFRKIFPWAVSSADKNKILARLAPVRTYQSLLFLSGYLDDAETAQVAARSIMSIALPSSAGYSGSVGSSTRKILEKVGKIITGEESDYFRARIADYLEKMTDDEGFVPMFNGTDLNGWQGLVENPVARSKMSKSELAERQKEADRLMTQFWSVKDGAIWFSGDGANLCTIKEYGDFEMLVDWRITKKGDSGIYLRGTPQVQIWDISRVEDGAQVGSGGLYNNIKNESKPLVVADNPVGDWNTFRITMNGERVSVWLNGIMVVDNIVFENYWDRSIPIFPAGPIELQAHGNELAFRDIYIREISSEDYNLTPDEKAEGFVSIFNGNDLSNWIGNKTSYTVDNGMIVVSPEEGSGGNLYTEKEYSDFIFRFEFQLTPGANNGLGIRAPLEGDAAYVGMELQILDNTAQIYEALEPYQYHGSVYGVIPARRGFLNPVGEWNSEEVIVRGTRVTVILNGEVIVDGDIAGPRDNGTMDHNEHPGLQRTTGHIGFLGHGSVVRFRNIRIREL